MRTKGVGPNGLGVPKGSPFKVDPVTMMKVAQVAKGLKDKKGDEGAEKQKAPQQKAEQVGDVDPFAGVPLKRGPFKFKGANSKNSSCWKGYKKVGTKPSPTNPGVTVNDCKKI